MTDTAIATREDASIGYPNAHYLRLIAGLVPSRKVVKIVHYEWCEFYSRCEETHHHREFFSAVGSLILVTLNPSTDVLTLVVQEANGAKKTLRIEEARRLDAWDNHCGYRCCGQEGWVDIIVDGTFIR